MALGFNGNVGIGTTSPTEKLHLNNPSGTGSFIRFQDTSGGGVYIGGRDERMELYSGGAERIRIPSGGNVLIGTTTDIGAKLNVNGSVVASTYATTSGALSVPSATYTTVFTFNNSDNMAGIFVVRFSFTNASTICFFTKSFDGGNTKLTIGSKTSRDGSDVISVSENAIQVYHNTGVAVTANWSFTRII